MATFNANDPTASGMVLTFDDEFNTASISSDSVANGTLWNDHLWYEAPSDGVTVANGIATIVNTDLSTVNSSGQGFAQTYGYFEADLELPNGTGAWPAFWLMSQAHAQNGANPASEIDIMEGQGVDPNLYFTTLHYDTGTAQDTYNPNPNWTSNLGVDLETSFHRYGLLWSPNSNLVTFYFDGAPIATATKYSTTDYSPDMVILSTNEGNMIGNNYTNGTSPPLYADYVRVYQFSSQDPTAVIAEAVSPPPGDTDPTVLANADGVMPGSASSTPTGGGTAATPTPSPGAMTPSPDGTIVAGSTGDIVSAAGNVFAINAAGQITENGAVMPATHAVTELAYVNGTINQQATAQNLWWSYNETTHTWTPTSDPLSTTGVQAEAPTLSVHNASGGEGSSIPLSMTASQAASDLAEANLTINIEGPAGTTFNEGTPNGDGVYTLEPSQLAHLAVTPPSGFTGTLPLIVFATDTEPSSGTIASSMPQVLDVAVSSATASGSGTGAGTGTSGDALTLQVAGDMYNGDPQITVSVDGQQVGTYDITAHHSQGQVQTITVGNFDPTAAHQIEVQFTNDAWDGQMANTDGHDRNVYVESVALNGQTIAGQNYAGNNASMGENSLDPTAAVMLQDGTASYNVGAAAGSGQTSPSSGSSGSTPSSGSSTGTGGDALTLQVAGDMYNGDPQIAVSVDGQQVGIYDVTAHRSQGQVQTITIGNFDPTLAHQVQVQFTNDAWDGQMANTDGHDRNVYVESVALNGQTLAGQSFAANNASMGEGSLDPTAAVMLQDGTVSYNVPVAATDASAAATLQPAMSDGTHNLYLLSAMPQTAEQIAAFNPAEDVLDLEPLLKAVGYTGSNPIADHVVALVQTSNGSTAVMVDPTGEDPNHGTTVVTLDHILPHNVPAADIWH